MYNIYPCIVVLYGFSCINIIIKLKMGFWIGVKKYDDFLRKNDVKGKWPDKFTKSFGIRHFESDIAYICNVKILLHIIPINRFTV